jgi:uncharacterized membrane protein
MAEMFTEYKLIIVFLHVISAVVWVGGMVALRYAAQPSLLKVVSPAEKLERISHAIKRFFIILFPFIIIIIITAVIMVDAYSLLEGKYSVLSYLKVALWSVMFINYIIAIKRRNRADKMLSEGDLVGAQGQLGLIGKVLVPMNIVLGITAVFIGTYFSSVM